MVYDLDMELRDLPAKKDPKGGSPKTPYPMRVADMPKKNGFFNIQFRDVLYAISLVAVGLLFIFQRQSEVHELSGTVTGLIKTVDALTSAFTAQQKLIDVNASDIRLQTERNLEQDKEIGQAQQQLITLVPDLREIRTKLNFVADLMDQKLKDKR
jgi:hypothetical protein